MNGKTKVKSHQVLKLRPEADALLEREQVRTGRKKQDIGHEWLMLAAKVKHLIPKEEVQP
jgi:hypothetical protein